MGYSVGYDDTWGRDIGYGVPAFCDHSGCGAEIDRGLAFVCGSQPHGGDHGCGLFFCMKHRRFAGARRDHVELCSRCYHGKGEHFTPTPDTIEWVRHKLKHPSWKLWRKEHPAEVKVMRMDVAMMVCGR